MCKGKEGNVLSNIELILPWNVVEACFSLQKNDNTCFFAANREEGTTSQISIFKQEDNSVKLQVIVMALGSSEENPEEGSSSGTLREDISDQPAERKWSLRTMPTQQAKHEEPVQDQGTRLLLPKRKPLTAQERMRMRIGALLRRAKQPAKMSNLLKGRKLVFRPRLNRDAKAASANRYSALRERKLPMQAVGQKWAGGEGEMAKPSNWTNMELGLIEGEKQAFLLEQDQGQEQQQDIFERAVEQEIEENQRREEEQFEQLAEEVTRQNTTEGASTVIILKNEFSKQPVACLVHGENSAETASELKVEGENDKEQECIPTKVIHIYPQPPKLERIADYRAGSGRRRFFTKGRDPLGTRARFLGKRQFMNATNTKSRYLSHWKSKSKPRMSRYWSHNTGSSMDIECELCNTHFKNHGYLFRHLRNFHRDHPKSQSMQEGVRPLMRIPCTICGKSISSIGNISAHMKQCHPEGDISVKCMECGKMYKSPASLRQHIRQRHQSERRKHTCELCDASFTESRSLKDHINCAHETTQVFACNKCWKVFLTKSRLRRHMYIHGEVRHTCKYCGKGFHIKDNMNKHIRIVHEAEKADPHECPFCGKMFNVKGNMTQHVKGVHLKQFPFHCSKCKAGFRRMRDMMAHMEKCNSEGGDDEGSSNGVDAATNSPSTSGRRSSRGNKKSQAVTGDDEEYVFSDEEEEETGLESVRKSRSPKKSPKKKKSAAPNPLDEEIELDMTVDADQGVRSSKKKAAQKVADYETPPKKRRSSRASTGRGARKTYEEESEMFEEEDAENTQNSATAGKKDLSEGTPTKPVSAQKVRSSKVTPEGKDKPKRGTPKKTSSLRKISKTPQSNGDMLPEGDGEKA